MNCGRLAIWKYTDSRTLRKVSAAETGQWGDLSNGSDSVSCNIEPESCWLPLPIVDLLVNHAEEHLRDYCGNTAINMLDWDDVEGTLAAVCDFSSGRSNGRYLYY